MPPAFAQFDEPHAWLIRGLVEYGWADISRLGGHIPPGAVAGFDLAELPDDLGRSGLALEVHALSGGRRSEDERFRFTAQVAQTDQGLGVVVRCPEANYFQEFAFDPANPSWVAGHIHQNITEYVPGFVDWRLAGGELSWSQRAGIPSVDGDPCSPLLANFLREQIRSNRPLHRGADHGWWLGESNLEAKGASAVQPIAVMGRGHDPTYFSAEYREELARQEAESGRKGVAITQATVHTRAPGNALTFMGGLGVFQGLAWMANAFITVLYFGSGRPGAIAFSMLAGLALCAGGFVGILGSRAYAAAKKGPLPYLSMAFSALVPICCAFGLPITIWAALTWRKPEVREGRG